MAWAAERNRGQPRELGLLEAVRGSCPAFSEPSTAPSPVPPVFAENLQQVNSVPRGLGGVPLKTSKAGLEDHKTEYSDTRKHVPPKKEITQSPSQSSSILSTSFWRKI